MKRQQPHVELIQPENQDEAMFNKLAALVAQKISQGQVNPAEMTTEELTDEVLLQPWMLPRETAKAILRLLPVPHQDKFRYCYEDYGCAECGTTKRPHQSLGLCAKCIGRRNGHVKASLARRTKPDHPKTVERNVSLLTGSTTNAKRVLQDMARKYPALPEGATANP